MRGPRQMRKLRLEAPNARPNEGRTARPRASPFSPHSPSLESRLEEPAPGRGEPGGHGRASIVGLSPEALPGGCSGRITAGVRATPSRPAALHTRPPGRPSAEAPPARVSAAASAPSARRPCLLTPSALRITAASQGLSHQAPPPTRQEL